MQNEIVFIRTVQNQLMICKITSNKQRFDTPYSGLSQRKKWPLLLSKLILYISRSRCFKKLEEKFYTPKKLKSLEKVSLKIVKTPHDFRSPVFHILANNVTNSGAWASQIFEKVLNFLITRIYCNSQAIKQLGTVGSIPLYCREYILNNKK